MTGGDPRTTFELLTLERARVLDRVHPDVFDHEVHPELARRYLASADNLLAVAVHDGEVVGMASAIAYLHPDKPLQLFINEVGVAEPFRRQGIASRLMRMVIEEGRSRGCVEAWVATEENNGPARALYDALSGKEDADLAVVYTFPLNAEAASAEGGH